MDVFENFIEQVEDLNEIIDDIEKESDTNSIPSPDVPLLKVKLRVKSCWDRGSKVNNLTS